MLWGIQLSDLCIVDLCTACGRDISSVKMYIRILIFQSINNSLLCFPGPPKTWRAVVADMQSCYQFANDCVLDYTAAVATATAAAAVMADPNPNDSGWW